MPQGHVLHGAGEKLPLSWSTISKAGMQYTAPHASYRSLSFSQLHQQTGSGSPLKVMGEGERTSPADPMSHSMDPSVILTMAAFNPNFLSLQERIKERHTGMASL